jgi:hypothetical protein
VAERKKTAEAEVQAAEAEPAEEQVVEAEAQAPHSDEPLPEPSVTLYAESIEPEGEA